MDERQIQRVKAVLEIRQHELRLGIDQQKQYARRAEREPDAVDQATISSEKELSLQQSNKEREFLRMVESA